jgi:hypothetical protein
MLRVWLAGAAGGRRGARGRIASGAYALRQSCLRHCYHCYRTTVSFPFLEVIRIKS